MYNMGFRFDNNMMEASFIAGLQLEGVELRHIGCGCWAAYGLSEENRRYIEMHSVKFWAL